MGYDDADLIQRWQRGDTAAFEALVRRWEQPVGRFLFRLVGQTELATDLCQEVFLRVFQALPRYRENGAFAHWLYRIALNVARDAARRGRRDPVTLPDSEIAGQVIAAESLLRQRELGEVVAQAVAALPEPLRVVLVLRHYERMSFAEMARLTATPASTLKSRFAAALVRLREHLKRRGWDPEEAAS